MVIWPSAVKQLVTLALEEDIGRGDCTSEAVIDAQAVAEAVVLVKEPARLAGIPVAELVFHTLDPRIEVVRCANDGDDVPGGMAVMRLRGPARSILVGERTALNFIARLSGIATLTREAVSRLDGTRTRLVDTRKTTPGWRLLEKYAVRMGGGVNHRFGLDDMVLIKDNHIAIAGGVRRAVERARLAVGLAQKIEVEVDTLAQLEEALDCGVDLILLDNMDTPTLAAAVRLTAGRVPLEASGNMTLSRLREVAETGVDYISMGALTHSAVSIDVGLDVVTVASACGERSARGADGEAVRP